MSNDDFTLLTISNSIVWFNQPSQVVDDPLAATTVLYSNVQDGWPGIGNIDADPLFVDPEGGDYRLSSGSPSIDAGNNWGVPVDELDHDEDGILCELFPVDLDGNPRFNADEADFDPGCGVPVVVDMGAYEYQFDPADQVTFADLNGDDVVGAADLLGLLVGWGPCGKGCCLADLDIDGSVGASDLLALLVNWGPCPPPLLSVVINEIRIRQAGGDVDDYFELRGPPGTSLDGLTYIVIGDNSVNGVNSGIIENVIDLSASTIPADGHFLVAKDIVTDDRNDTCKAVPDLIIPGLTFEAHDSVTHLLVLNFTGAHDDDLDLDNNCLLDVTPWDAVIDSIALVPVDPQDCFYGPSIGPCPDPDDPNPAHMYRCDPDGTWTCGVVEPVCDTDTPGVANLNCAPRPG